MITILELNIQTSAITDIVDLGNERQPKLFKFMIVF